MDHVFASPLVDIDARIASALAAERQAVIAALRAAADKLLDQERDYAKSRMTEADAFTRIASCEIGIRIVRAASGARRRAREGNRFAEPDAQRELIDMSTFWGGAEIFCSIKVLRLMTQAGDLKLRRNTQSAISDTLNGELSRRGT